MIILMTMQGDTVEILYDGKTVDSTRTATVATDGTFTIYTTAPKFAFPGWLDRFGLLDNPGTKWVVI